MLKKIGSHLKNLRLISGYSLREAGRKSGLSHGYIRDVENGFNRKNESEFIPMPQTLRKFALAYQTSYEELMKISGHLEALVTSPTPFEIKEINLRNVLYVQVTNNLVCFYLFDSSVFTEMTLNEYMLLEAQLDRSYIRIHNGLYINKDQIRAYDVNRQLIYFDSLKTGQNLHISRSDLIPLFENTISGNKVKSEMSFSNMMPMVTYVKIHSNAHDCNHI